MSANIKTDMWSHISKGQNPVPPHLSLHPSETMLLFEEWEDTTSPCPRVISGGGGFSCPFS